MRHFQSYLIEREHKKASNLISKMGNDIFEIGIFAAITLPTLIYLTT